MKVSRTLSFERFTATILLGFALALLGTNPVWAQSTGATAAGAVVNQGEMLERVGFALLKYVVLAIVIESAMSTLFQWRQFQKRAYRKGWKTPITVVVAFIVLSGYPKLNAVTDVLEVFNAELATDHPSTIKGWVTRFLTALLIAGGSASFVSLYQKLGLRAPVAKDDQKVVEQTSVEITVERGTAVSGPITLQLDSGASVKVAATQWLFHGVSPGLHLIQASGTVTGGSGTANKSMVIDVNPAIRSSVEINFQ